MGRSLVNVPLHVLGQQASELSVKLRNPVVAEAFRTARLDPDALVAELAESSAEAYQGSARRSAARTDLEVLALDRAEWRRAYADWVTLVRRLLASVGPEVAEVALVRRQLSRHAGRSFRGGRDDLVLTLDALDTHAEALQIATWFSDPRPSGAQLAAAAAALESTERERTQVAKVRSDAARERKLSLQRLIRRVQAAWALAQLADPRLPDLTLDALSNYVAERRTDQGAAAAPEGGSTASPAEL